MSSCSSPDFLNISASGPDWRAATKAVLEEFKALRAAQDPAVAYNFGFVYVTDRLAEESQGIIGLLRSVTGVENWAGAVGLGIFGSGVDYIDEPAVTILLGRFPSDDFLVLPSFDEDISVLNKEGAGAWIDAHAPMLSVIHGDSTLDLDYAGLLGELQMALGGFLVGGLTSSRDGHFVFSGQDALSRVAGGVTFSDQIEVSTALTQGCAPLGPLHTVTRCEENIIMELDGQRAFDVFAADLKDMARKSGVRPDEEDAGAPQEHAFRGEVHIAFPVAGSDQRDYLVRNALGLDPETGWIAASQTIENGDTIMFVHRDQDTVQADLSRMLLDLRARVTKERGAFNPQAALYISCVARAVSDYRGRLPSEADLIREILGDVPLAGFFANGEISNGRLYGYTGVLILFH